MKQNLADVGVFGTGLGSHLLVWADRMQPVFATILTLLAIIYGVYRIMNAHVVRKTYKLEYKLKQKQLQEGEES